VLCPGINRYPTFPNSTHESISGARNPVIRPHTPLESPRSGHSGKLRLPAQNSETAEWRPPDFGGSPRPGLRLSGAKFLIGGSADRGLSKELRWRSGGARGPEIFDLKNRRGVTFGSGVTKFSGPLRPHLWSCRPHSGLILKSLTRAFQ
jgi:hypothetical protein